MAAIAESTAQVLSDLSAQKGLVFRDSLSSEHLNKIFARHICDFRDRAYPPDVTLMGFCSQLISFNTSCRMAVVNINHDRLARGLDPVSSATSAYCQARFRLPLGLIKDLAIETSHYIEYAAPEQWLWKGHHAKLIDGSTLSMSDTPENQAV